ncbi:hypothetical protein D3C87_1519390 [compost metagenome]
MFGGDGGAGRQTLEVPLEWRRQRFVEIVDIEDHVALWRGEPPEVHEVRVPTRLHADTTGRCGAEVRRHDGRPASIEGKRGGRHAAESDGYQLEDPPLIRCLQALHGIDAVWRGMPTGLRCARGHVAQGAAFGGAFVRRQVTRRMCRDCGTHLAFV